MKPSNIFQNIPGCLTQEWTQDLVRARQTTIERIVSHGHRSADGFWYDQDWDEWVLLLSGKARIEFEGEPQETELVPGDHLLIPAHCRHRISWTAPDRDTVWLAVHIDRCAGAQDAAGKDTGNHARG